MVTDGSCLCAVARWSKAQCVEDSKMEDCNLEGDEFLLANVLG